MKFKFDPKKESDQDFLNRVITGVFRSDGKQDIYIRSVNAIIYEAVKDPHYADLVTRLVMIVTGNAIGRLDRDKDEKTPAEIFAEFVCDIFNNRYLYYLEEELGGKSRGKKET